MERVYYIKTNLTLEENQKIVSEYDQETSKLVNELTKSVINLDEVGADGFMTSYVIGEDEHIEFIKKISDQNNIKIEIVDITEDFIRGDIDIDDREFVEYRKSKMK